MCPALSDDAQDDESAKSRLTKGSAGNNNTDVLMSQEVML
jgi:hypothetical protein